MNLNRLTSRTTRLTWTHAALILVAVFLAANWQVLAGRVYERWDAYDLGAPAFSLLGDFARAGRLLYWNPWIAGGSPDFAVAGSGVFSPDLLLYAWITGMGPTAFLAYWMIVWVSGGIGMLCLARHLRAPVWGGLVVALGFMFSGFYTGHGQHTGILYSYTLIPFIVWRFDRAIMQRNLLAGGQAGVLWGLSALAGYPALTICTFGLMVTWFGGRFFCITTPERFRHARFGLLVLMIAAVVGTAVLSPAYLSGWYEGRGYSDRSEPLTREFALASNAYDPGALATFSSPSLVVFKLLQRSLWAYTDVSSISIYTGGLTCLLALLALLGGTERGWRRFLFVVALCAMGTAISQVLPLRGWLYDLVPLTRYFRHGSLFRGFFLFLVSVLAFSGAIDLERWRADASIGRKFTFLALGLASVAAVAFSIVVFIARTEQPYGLLAYAHFVFVWGGLIVAALILRRGAAVNPALVPTLLIVFASVDGVLTCHFSQYVMFKNGPRPALAEPASSALDRGPSGFTRTLGTGSNLNILFKEPAFRSYAPFLNGFQKVMVKNPQLYTMALGGAEERIWFSTAAPEVLPNQASFDRFVERIAALNVPVIVRHSRESMLHSGAESKTDSATIEQAAPAINVPATVIQYLPDKLVLEATAPADGWLMVTDRWSRSWRATVNGVPESVACANFIFRAVPVVRGANRIEFSFQPFGMPALFIVSWSIVGLVSALSLLPLMHMPAGRRAPNEPSRQPVLAELLKT